MERILLVDDDTRILSAYQRQLRSHFNVTTALGPEKAFKEIEKSGHFSVVVSDFRMPKMDGITFLNEIRLRNPETIRVMLTGFADQQTAIDCINENRIFRFLTKPYPAKDLIQVLDAGLKQYRLEQAEKELLENTLNGAIKTLTEVLSMAEPRAFGKAERIRSRVKELAKQLEVEDIWEIEIAAMLSQIGRISIPGPLSIKMDNEEIFTGKELDMIARTPEAGRDLIRNIPRLENVAEMVYYQTKNYDGSGFPADSVTAESIPFWARILKVLIDLIDLEVGDILIGIKFSENPRG